LPALNKARENAKRTSCLNNQKNIYAGLTFYQSDWSGWLPKYTTTDRNEFIYAVNSYLHTKADLLQEQYQRIASKEPRGLFYCPSITNAQSSPIWQGGASTASYYAPSYVPSSRQNSQAQNGVQGGWSRYESTGSSVRLAHVKFAQVHHKSVLFGESNYANATSGIYYPNSCYSCYDSVYPPMSGWQWGWSWNHNKSINLTFPDGHAANFHWNGQRQMSDELIPY